MKPIVFLDVESTGLDPLNDRIVELCLLPMGGELKVRRFNPEIPISAETTAFHGITDADVLDCPPFRQRAASIQQIVDGAVLCGYNIRRFDSVILDAELRRAGQPGLSRDAAGKLTVQEIDLYQIWARHEPRSLIAAAKQFADIDLENAHSAAADTEVLPKVLEGMLFGFGIKGIPIDELCALCIPEGEVDRDGKFKRLADGTIVFNVGQSTKGKPVTSDSGFLEWMLKKDFTDETKAYARQFLEEIRGRERAALQAAQREVSAQEALF